MKYTGFLILVIVLGGCASQPPVPISKIPAEQFTVAEVRMAPQRFIGTEVRWGGTIVKVENRRAKTWIEVVSRTLESNGRPDVSGQSHGRFIASIPGFADPLVLGVGNLLTVVGTVEEQVSRDIGEYEYLFPVVRVSGSYLWRVEPGPDAYEYQPPWWYYDPWPYYPWPYYPYLW
jgi:outer membrane lipoprotein